ncbi:MAG TPA: DNA-3-methyladenine glycosylase [Bacteroidales bacterium]|nr:DNA-3-methyladenine glycosylase [Bacteroidales bacterium]HRZ49129.1 DNA-3-methyladenine glycosylase [Bacteroidales bacterium]
MEQAKMIRRLCADFYRRHDVVLIARELLGKVLCHETEAGITKLMISETEAYAGITDRASHAYNGRRTPRTEVMYRGGGVAYVYLCYGIHHLFNVVTGVEDVPDAVLVRGGQVVSGMEQAAARLGRGILQPADTIGPGRLSKAMGIHTGLSGTSLLSGPCWIEDHGVVVPEADITVTPRIGVDYAGEDALRPFRFVVSL